LWNFYENKVEEFKPYDALICNGDAIDGKGERSGGTELLTTDRTTQCKMATKCLLLPDTETIVMTYGTPYHTGNLEDWENIVADKVNVMEIRSHGFWEINGKNFNVKHFISASSLPHLRPNALAREIVQNRIFYQRGEQEKADVLIRPHVHFTAMIDYMDCKAIITPALQGYGSKYGARKCSAPVDFGITIIDVYDDGEIKCTIPRLTGKAQKPLTTVLC